VFELKQWRDDAAARMANLYKAHRMVGAGPASSGAFTNLIKGNLMAKNTRRHAYQIQTRDRDEAVNESCVEVLPRIRLEGRDTVPRNRKEDDLVNIDMCEVSSPLPSQGMAHWRVRWRWGSCVVPVLPNPRAMRWRNC